MKRVVCVLIVGLFAFGVLGSLGSAQAGKSVNIITQPVIQKKMYVPHAPIKITSDIDFDTQFPGRVISGYNISGTTSSNLIYIGNCSKAFMVKDCYINHGINGLYLYECSNGTLKDNDCSTNFNGIILWYSSSNTITNNNCLANNDEYGIYLYSSKGNTLTYKNCTKNNYGI